jgi:hypothetical protein
VKIILGKEIMEPLTALFCLIALLITMFLSFQSIKLFRSLNVFFTSANVTNVSIVKCNNKAFQNKENIPAKAKSGHGMNRELKGEIAFRKGVEKLKPMESEYDESRKYPRKEFQTVVEFIKEGKLFKETTRDLSYSGIFLKSKTPDQYSIDDIFILTFQISNNRPQKHTGQVVRKESNGIGIKFIN